MVPRPRERGKKSPRDHCGREERKEEERGRSFSIRSRGIKEGGKKKEGDSPKAKRLITREGKRKKCEKGYLIHLPSPGPPCKQGRRERRDREKSNAQPQGGKGGKKG